MVSENKQYIRIRVLEDVTIEMVENFSREAAQLSDETGINRILSDERGGKSLTSVTQTYWFVNTDSPAAKRSWKIAVLQNPENADYDAVETVMRNAGFTLKIFTDQTEALDWLLKE